MITFIALIVLVGIGIYVFVKYDYYYDIIGLLMIVLFGISLILHSIFWGLKTYDYHVFTEKRNAFENTLSTARKNGNEYETAAIVKSVADWNIKLAVYQYNNTTIFFDQYIDDRIELLKPIQ